MNSREGGLDRSVPAPMGRRIAAYLVDGVIAFGATMISIAISFAIAYALFTAGAVELAALVGLLGYVLAGLGYSIYVLHLTATRGYTPGKRLLGLGVVDATTGEPIGWGRAILRGLVLGLLVVMSFGVLAVVMPIVAHNHPRRQAWHDLAVNSIVVAANLFAHPAPDAPIRAERPSRPPAHGPDGGELPGAAPIAIRPASPAALVSAIPPPATVASPHTRVPPADSPPRVVPPPGARLQANPPAGASATGQGWVIVGDRGDTIHVAGAVVLGRDPDNAGYERAVMRRIDDPEHTMSKTHALLTVDDGLLWIEDLSSTNGVAVSIDGKRSEIEPRARHRLDSGSRFWLGGRHFDVDQRR